jgi:hypothetical protein
VDPIVSAPLAAEQMLKLLAELLRSKDLSDLTRAGAWGATVSCFMGRPSQGRLAMDLELIKLAAEDFRSIGPPPAAVSISRGKASRAILLGCVGEIFKCFAGDVERPDIEAVVTSGLFDLCIETIEAVAAAGVKGLQDTHHLGLCNVLSQLPRFCAQPGCEAKLRGIADALAFCLDPEHNLENVAERGLTSNAITARICCSVFGRDESGSQFSFTPHHIDMLIADWSQTVRAVGAAAPNKPTADRIFAAHLSILDANKSLLLQNGSFIPYLVDALLLDPNHPRAGMHEELKAWCQQHHCEALAQLSVHDMSREALLRDESVVPALQVVLKAGLSAKARELAAAALSALSDRKLVMATEGQKHIMLSCEFACCTIMIDKANADGLMVSRLDWCYNTDQWDVQATIKRLNESLIDRRYATWFDLTNMKGE